MAPGSPTQRARLRLTPLPSVFSKPKPASTYAEVENRVEALRRGLLSALKERSDLQSETTQSSRSSNAASQASDDGSHSSKGSARSDQAPGEALDDGREPSQARLSQAGPDELDRSQHGNDSLPGNSLLGTPKLTDFYQMFQELGKGHIGTVRLCRDRSASKHFACKTILKSSIQSERHVEEVVAEIIAMASIQIKIAPSASVSAPSSPSNNAPSSPSSSFVRLHEIFDDAEAVHFVLDYCECSDLLKHLVDSPRGRMTEEECASMLRQLLPAVNYLHTCGFIHRDLKPENILLTRGDAQKRPPALNGPNEIEYKVADLGSAARSSDGEGGLFGLVGSPKYMAPEVVQGQEYGKEVDVWSLGVILYACLSGRQPFTGSDMEQVFAAVSAASPDFAAYPWQMVPPDARDLVCSMLAADPKKRITIPQILCHPWLSRHCNGVSKLAASPYLSKSRSMNNLSVRGGRPLPLSVRQCPAVQEGPGDSMKQGSSQRAPSRSGSGNEGAVPKGRSVPHPLRILLKAQDSFKAKAGFQDGIFFFGSSGRKTVQC